MAKHSHAELRPSGVHLGRMSENQDATDERHDDRYGHRKCAQLPVAHEELIVRLLSASATRVEDPDSARNGQKEDKDDVVCRVEASSKVVGSSHDDGDADC